MNRDKKAPDVLTHLKRPKRQQGSIIKEKDEKNIKVTMPFAICKKCKWSNKHQYISNAMRIAMKTKCTLAPSEERSMYKKHYDKGTHQWFYESLTCIYPDPKAMDPIDGSIDTIFCYSNNPKGLCTNYKKKWWRLK